MTETELGVLIVGVPEPTNRVKSAGPVAPASPVAPVPPPPPLPDPVRPVGPADPFCPPVTTICQLPVSSGGGGDPGGTNPPVAVQT